MKGIAKQTIKGGGAGGIGVLEEQIVIDRQMTGTIGSISNISYGMSFTLDNGFWGVLHPTNSVIDIYNESRTKVCTYTIGVGYACFSIGIGNNKFLFAYTNSQATEVTMRTYQFNGVDTISLVGEITTNVPSIRGYYLQFNLNNFNNYIGSSLKRIQYDETNNVVFFLCNTSNATSSTSPITTITLDNNGVATGVSVNGNNIYAGQGYGNSNQNLGIVKAYGKYYQIISWIYSGYVHQTISALSWNGSAYVVSSNTFNTYDLDNGYNGSVVEFVNGGDDYLALCTRQGYFVLLTETCGISKRINGCAVSDANPDLQRVLGKVGNGLFAVLSSTGNYSFNNGIYIVNTSTNSATYTSLNNWCGASTYVSCATKIENNSLVVWMTQSSPSSYSVGLIGITDDGYVLTGNKAGAYYDTEHFIGNNLWDGTYGYMFYKNNVEIIITTTDKYNYQALEINVSGSGKCGILNNGTLTETTFSTSLVTSDTGAITLDGNSIAGVIQWWYAN